MPIMSETYLRLASLSSESRISNERYIDVFRILEKNVTQIVNKALTATLKFSVISRSKRWFVLPRNEAKTSDIKIQSLAVEAGASSTCNARCINKSWSK